MSKQLNPYIEGMLQKHEREAKVGGIAKRIQKQQKPLPKAKGRAPEVDNAFSKMMVVEKTPELMQRFKDHLLQVKTDGLTARENYSKIVAARNNFLQSAKMQNTQNEFDRLLTEAPAPGTAEDRRYQQRMAHLKAQYHAHDPSIHDIPKPDGMLEKEAERLGAMIAKAMEIKGKGKGQRLGGDEKGAKGTKGGGRGSLG